MTPTELSKTTLDQRRSAEFYQEIFRDLTELQELRKFRDRFIPGLQSAIDILDTAPQSYICPECGKFRLKDESGGWVDCQYCGDDIPF